MTCLVSPQSKRQNIWSDSKQALCRKNATNGQWTFTVNQLAAPFDEISAQRRKASQDDSDENAVTAAKRSEEEDDRARVHLAPLISIKRERKHGDVELLLR